MVCKIDAANVNKVFEMVKEKRKKICTFATNFNIKENYEHKQIRA